MKKLLALALTALLAVGCTGCDLPLSILFGGGAKADTPMASKNAGAAYAVATEESAYAMPSSPFEREMFTEPNTAEYDVFNENQVRSVAEAPLSTFAADVDTASYAIVRRQILGGAPVEPDQVRIEEMLNYFDYDYPQPEGSEPFSVSTTIAPCPWNADIQLLRIGLQAKRLEADQLPPSNLVFLIDVSGSMDDTNKLPLVKQAFLLLAESLTENDCISIVTYASYDEIVLDGVSGDNKPAIMSGIENLSASGSTQGSAGIQTAYELAQKHFIEGGNNRVILATDGDMNVGVTSEGELTRLIKEKAKTGVFLSVMGFGDSNLKDNKLEALADNGNGNYSLITDVAEARRVLCAELGANFFTIAKDVKLQVEFNPAKLKGYRLIGYENRLMDSDDFADDTKDGGELGAGHRVTVLYELIPVDSPIAIAAPELKYQQSGEATGSDEWLTLSIRYKQPDADASELLTYPVDDSSVVNEMPEHMRFAAAVAQFGMLLRGSEYLGSTTLDSISEALNAMPELMSDPYKDEFRYLVNRYSRS